MKSVTQSKPQAEVWRKITRNMGGHMPSRGWAGFGLEKGGGRAGGQWLAPSPFYWVARSNFRSPKRWADSCGAEPGMLEFPQSFLYTKAGMLGERKGILLLLTDQIIHRTSKGRNS